VGKYRRLTLASAVVFERNVSDLGKKGKKGKKGKSSRRHFCACEQHAARGSMRCGTI